jgi:ribosomal protein S18 acetylase RimI-like enzyme
VEISIRKATTEDYISLCELIDEVDDLHRGNLPYLFQKPNGPIREQDYYSGLITDENVGLFVAVSGQRLVGFVHAVIMESPTISVFLPRRHANVENIGVKSGFQKHGIGRMLMDMVHEWAVPKGAASIELNVYEFNKNAIAFYERLGYKILSRKMSKTVNSE